MIKILKKLNYKNFFFQDSDDLMMTNRVETCKDLLKKHKVVINDVKIHGSKNKYVL